MLIALLPACGRTADASATPWTGSTSPAVTGDTGSSPAAPAPATPVRPPLESTYRESALRRTENVFFISLPFTALYAALLTGGAALAIERGDVRRPEMYLGISVGLATTASALIAWRDLRAPVPVPPVVPASAPAESGTILIDSPR